MAQYGFNDFAVGDDFGAADADGILRQTIMYFADATARDAALSGIEDEGMMCYTAAGGHVWQYDGTAWVPFMSAWTDVPSQTWTNLTKGNGTESAEYRYVGSELRYRGVFVLGSTSAVTGAVSLLIPNSETSRATGGGSIGSAYLVDDSASKPYSGITIVSANDTQITFVGSDDNTVGTSTPFVFGTGDTIRWDLLIAL